MSRRGISPKGKAPQMNWEETDDPDCVAEDGWQDEPERLWTCTMCKKYVKMTHLLKLWPRAQARISGPRREGLASSCLSSHFTHRYHEVTIAVGVRNARPEIMLYSNMAMVWADIVLHKDVDWRTVAGRNVSLLDQSHHFIDTTWNQASDCWPRWSNRRYNDSLDGTPQRQAPAEVFHVQNFGDFPPRNDVSTPPPTFGSENQGYYPDYNEYSTGSNMPHSSRATYSRNTYDTYDNFPKEEKPDSIFDTEWNTFHGYGRGTYGTPNTPPPSIPSTREREEMEYERQMHEATIQSQEEYIRKLEEDARFMEMQYNSLHDVYSRGPYSDGAGPSRRHDSDSSED